MKMNTQIPIRQRSRSLGSYLAALPIHAKSGREWGPESAAKLRTSRDGDSQGWWHFRERHGETPRPQHRGTEDAEEDPYPDEHGSEDIAKIAEIESKRFYPPLLHFSALQRFCFSPLLRVSMVKMAVSWRYFLAR